MSKDFKRIYELEDRIFNGNPCVYTHDGVAPETFAVDIAALFNADVEKDVLRNVLVGDEEVMCNCTFIVLPESVESKDLFVKLADYVNGIEMEYALCCCKDKEGVYKRYEIDPSDEYVEGGYEPVITNEESDGVIVGEENIMLLDDRLELGADKNVLPSPTVMFIDQGEHYIDHLIGPDDEELM